jgi:hypothetical protein
VREGRPAAELELDGAVCRLRWRVVDAARAQERDVADAGGLRAVEKRQRLRHVAQVERRRDEVDGADARERGVVGGGVVPVEAHVGAVAGRGADGGAGGTQARRDAATGLAGAAEDQDRAHVGQ